jgi:hypothetical protein
VTTIAIYLSDWISIYIILTLLGLIFRRIRICIRLKIKPNSVRIRFLSCQMFVLPSTGIYINTHLSINMFVGRTGLKIRKFSQLFLLHWQTHVHLIITWCASLGYFFDIRLTYFFDGRCTTVKKNDDSRYQ